MLKEKMTRMLMAGLIASVFVGGAGMGNARAAEPVLLHVGSTSTPEHSWYRSFEVFTSEVEKNSKGTMKPLREFASQHGGERQMVEACLRGQLDMVVTSDIGIAAVFPPLGFTNLPYLFPDYADVDKRYLNGWMGKALAQFLQEKSTGDKGIRVLAFGENDFRAVTNSRRPVKSAADLKGLKLRTPEIPMYVSFYKNMGVLPTPMAVPEIATALQQKTVDGQENGAIITYAYGWYEFQKYVTKTKHIYSGMEILISKKKWDSLTPEQKKIVEEAAKKMGAAQVTMNRNDVETFYQNMAKKGLEVIDSTPQLKKDMAEAAKKVWAEPKTTDTFGKSTMDRILKEVGTK